jgi:hypothetical protein
LNPFYSIQRTVLTLSGGSSGGTMMRLMGQQQAKDCTASR